jgi:PhoH-like ATPase
VTGTSASLRSTGSSARMTAPAVDTDELAALAADVTTTVTVVLDTSVIMADATAHLAYPGAAVVIPLTVIDELDANKTRTDEAGRNAREFLRTIESLRIAAGGDISAPVALTGGGTFRIEPNGLRLDELTRHHLDTAVPDHRIIAAALGLAADGRPGVSVVSNDAALRIKAAVLGLATCEHTPGRTGIHSPNRAGWTTVTAGYATIDAASDGQWITITDLPPDEREQLDGVLENEFVLLAGTALGMRRVGAQLRPMNRRSAPWGAAARNKEQGFALDLLLDSDVPLVALRGHAGTGKSLLAIAAGLEQVVEKKRYQQLMILRPMIAVGRQDMGFLPGDVADKLAPWFSAVVDSMVALSTTGQSFKDCQLMLAGLVTDGKVALEAVTFLRGRSLQNTFVIVDEAQNLDPSTVRTCVSRLGRGSKLVLTGDSSQIDLPYASAVTCGLNVAVDAFAGVPEFGQVWFSKGERSRMADLAAERM